MVSPERIDKRVVAIVEARMTSTRLPGKVLLPACGKPLLEHLIERLLRVSNIDSIVIATTINDTDNPIVELAKKLKIYTFRGSEHDVLGRVLGAAYDNNADIIVEITGDCPAIDPDIVEEGIKIFKNADAEYVENTNYPGGMNYSIFETTTLAEVECLTRDDIAAREHVTLPIYERPEKFKLLRVDAPAKYRHKNVCIELDELSDYEMIKKIFEALYPDNPKFSLTDILNLLKKNPEIGDMNLNVQRKAAR